MCVNVSVRSFTSSDTQMETVVLPVRVVDSGSGLVVLGSTPLLVPQAFGLSNNIDTKVLRIQTRGDLICTVRLLNTDTGVPSLGQLVREEESGARKGNAGHGQGRGFHGGADPLRCLCLCSIRQTDRFSLSRK